MDDNSDLVGRWWQCQWFSCFGLALYLEQVFHLHFQKFLIFEENPLNVNTFFSKTIVEKIPSPESKDQCNLNTFFAKLIHWEINISVLVIFFSFQTCFLFPFVFHLLIWYDYSDWIQQIPFCYGMFFFFFYWAWVLWIFKFQKPSSVMF